MRQLRKGGRSQKWSATRKAEPKWTFNFFASPITTPGVDVDVAVRFADKVTSLSQGQGLENELTAIIVFPIITDPAIYPREDFIVNKRSDRAYYVGKNIEIQTWRRAQQPGRLRLTLDNFVASVMSIPDKQFGLRAKRLLIDSIHRSFQALK
jgi:predicted nucleotidyltransferase